MAWWRFGRAERSGADAVASRPESDPVSPVGSSEPAADRATPSDAAPIASSGSSSIAEPQGWRLLDPPATTAARPMPLTFDATVQRALASHSGPGQLLATARPLGHEVRRDGPIGTVGSLMRAVGTDAASLAPATHTAGPDLVLHRRIHRSEDDAAPSATPIRGGMVPSTIARSVSGLPSSPSPAPTVMADTVHPVDASVDPSDSSDSSLSVSGSGWAPEPAVSRAVDAIGGSDGVTGAPVDAAPLVSGAASVASSAPAAPTVGLTGALVTTASPRVLRAVPDAGAASTVASYTAMTDPLPLRPLVGGTAESIARSADVSAQSSAAVAPGPSSDTASPPLETRRRRFAVEVSSPSVPVSLEQFFESRSTGTSRDAGGSAGPTGSGGAARSFDTERSSADGDSSDDAAMSTTSTISDIPTLGRRLGLGVPMSALPPSAVVSRAVDDPFAGWDRPVDLPSDLPLAASDGVPIVSAAGSAQAPGSPGSGIAQRETLGTDSFATSAPGAAAGNQSGPIGETPFSGPSEAGMAARSTDTALVMLRRSPSLTSAAATVGGSAPRADRSGADVPVRGLLLSRSLDASVSTSSIRALGAPAPSGPTVVPLQREADLSRSRSRPAPSGGSTAAAFGPAAGSVGPATIQPSGSSTPSPVGISRDIAGPSLQRWVDAPNGDEPSVGGDGAADTVSAGETSSTGGHPFGDGPSLGSPLGALTTAVGPAAVLHRTLDLAPGPRSVTEAVIAQRLPMLTASSPQTVAAVAPTASSSDGAVTMLQREPDGGGGSAESMASAAGGSAAGAGGAATPGEADLDQLAGRLYDRIRQRLRRELLDDRERAGFALDRMR